MTLSNLDKVLYPSGFTKAQVIDYYARIAPIMIPHLRGRCLTFRRYPNGSDTTGFFEKRCPSHRPDWVDVATGPGDRRGGVDYCVIEERAALVWAANLAALELHAPMALAAELDVPRAIVFDFDPARRRRSSTAARSRSRARGARRRRSRGLVQDVGIEGPADVRADQLPAASHTKARPTSRSPSGRCSSSRCRAVSRR